MERIALLLFDIVLVGGYLVIGFITFMLIQLFFYKVFKFNIYKTVMNYLFK